MRTKTRLKGTSSYIPSCPENGSEILMDSGCLRRRRKESGELLAMAGDLLKELPSFNKQNFSKFNTDSAVKCSHQRPVVYLPTKDMPDQGCTTVIVTDKANILLRYLHHQWETKNNLRKRDPTSAELATSDDYKPSAKVPRRTGPAESTTEPP